VKNEAHIARPIPPRPRRTPLRTVFTELKQEIARMNRKLAAKKLACWKSFK